MVTTPNAKKDLEKLGHTYIADGNLKFHYIGNQFDRFFFSTLKMQLPYNTEIPLQYLSRKMEINF